MRKDLDEDSKVMEKVLQKEMFIENNKNQLPVSKKNKSELAISSAGITDDDMLLIDESLKSHFLFIGLSLEAM